MRWFSGPGSMLRLLSHTDPGQVAPGQPAKPPPAVPNLVWLVVSVIRPPHHNPTPGTLGVSRFPGFYGRGVLCVLWSLFPFGVWSWFWPACRGGAGARFHGPRRFLLPDGGVPAAGLGESGCEHGDLGFPGDGGLGRGGVREFRACFLRAFGVPLPPGDVQGAQGGAGGGVRRGGERVQR